MGKAIQPETKELEIIKEFSIKEITQDNLDLMKKQILEIPETPEDSKQYATVKDFHIAAKKILPLVEARRIEIKAEPLEKCRLIDKVSREAKEMITPLIELSGGRRFAWEKIAEDKKAAEAKIEYDRLAMINGYIRALEYDCSPIEYGLSSEKISGEIRFLEEIEISAVDYSDKAEEAEQILNNALSFASANLESSLKFESDQAAAAKLKADNEAAAKKLADDQAAFKAKQDKAEADQKKKDDAAQKLVDEQAQTIRVGNENLEAATKALEKKADALKAKEDAAALEKYSAMYDGAIRINLTIANDTAIAHNRQYNDGLKLAQDIDAGIENAKLKSDKARSKLVAADKKTITGMINVINTFISELNCLDGEYKTDEGAQVELDLIIRIKEALGSAEKAGCDLV